MAEQLGYECKAYRCATDLDDESNTPALATWIEMPFLRSVELPFTPEEHDITDRGNNGFEAIMPGLVRSAISIEFIEDADDAGQTAIITAGVNRTAIAACFLNGSESVTGSRGLAANFNVFDLNRSEPIDGVVTITATLKIRSYASWYTAAGS